MRLLCALGLHRLAWMPVVTLGEAGTSWLQLRRCARCGRVVEEQR